MTRPYNQTHQANCPYCGKPIETLSKDHIFPQFLGGTRKIDCCRDCNSFFGHSFEAISSKMLQANHVFVSSWGIPLRGADPTWKAAFSHEGKTYDLSVGQTGVKPELSKPVIKYDDTGDIASGEFSNKKQAENFARTLLKKGKAREIQYEYVPPSDMSLEGLECFLTLGPDIRRLALKMSIAVSTLLPAFDLEEVSEARSYLCSKELVKPVANTSPAYSIYEAIDVIRNSLSHVIYVERSNIRVYSLVQFYGVIQLFCQLGTPLKNAQECAMLASLDPVMGAEKFTQIDPLELPDPPKSIPLKDYPNHLQLWVDKFREEAIKRGATHPPNLQIKSINIEK